MIDLTKNLATNQELSEWTVMIYFAADNDLIPAAAADLAEIKEIGSNKEVHVIAQNIVPATGLTARYRLRKGTFLEEDILQLLEPNLDHPPASLSDFTCWAIEEYPARRYMVILWGHGLGWEGHEPHPIDPKNTTGRKMNSADKILNVGKRRTLDRMMQTTYVARTMGVQRPGATAVAVIDEEPETAPPDFLDSDNLRDALAKIKVKINDKAGISSTNGEARKIDILGMDICLMAMAEVGYQVRESVDFMVASEEAEPAESWPYASILSDLRERPDLPPDDLAVRIARKYILYFQNEGKFITQSVCNLNRAKDLLHQLKELARVLKNAFTSNDEQVMYAVMMARSMAQSYYMKEFIDLYHFCDQLLKICEGGEAKFRRMGEPSERLLYVRDNCAEILNVIRAQENIQGRDQSVGFVYDYGFYGFPLRESNGVSIYFPCDRIEPGYADLDFNRNKEADDETTWNDFLTEFVLGFTGPDDLPPPTTGNAPTSNNLKGKAGDPNKGKAGDPNKVPTPPSEHWPQLIGGSPEGNPSPGDTGSKTTSAVPEWQSDGETAF
jgi:hypothetical protein